MIIEPRVRENVCLNAHPQGCFRQVRDQIRYVTDRDRIVSPARVLIIGASNGYGLAARIVSTFGSGAATVGVAYERPVKGKRTASAGWYNNEAFTALAQQHGHQAWNVNGDAFSSEIKEQVLKSIGENLGQIDFLVYSIASPRRLDPRTGELYSSVIKPIGQSYTAKTVDFLTGEVCAQTSEPATAEQVAQTIKVMGGEDWNLRPDVQAEVADLWQRVDSDNIDQLADLEGFREAFLRHNGFGIPGIDYSRDVTL